MHGDQRGHIYCGRVDCLQMTNWGMVNYLLYLGMGSLTQLAGDGLLGSTGGHVYLLLGSKHHAATVDHRCRRAMAAQLMAEQVIITSCGLTVNPEPAYTAYVHTGRTVYWHMVVATKQLRVAHDVGRVRRPMPPVMYIVTGDTEVIVGDHAGMRVITGPVGDQCMPLFIFLTAMC